MATKDYVPIVDLETFLSSNRFRTMNTTEMASALVTWFDNNQVVIPIEPIQTQPIPGFDNLRPRWLDAPPPMMVEHTVARSGPSGANRFPAMGVQKSQHEMYNEILRMYNELTTVPEPSAAELIAQKTAEALAVNTKIEEVLTVLNLIMVPLMAKRDTANNMPVMEATSIVIESISEAFNQLKNKLVCPYDCDDSRPRTVRPNCPVHGYM